MRAAGRLLDPPLWLRLAGGSSNPSLLGRLVRWSVDRASSAATSTVLASLPKYVPGFAAASFARASAADLSAVLAAVSSPRPSAELARLAGGLGEGIAVLLARGAEESARAAGGARQGAVIVQALAEPRILQARFIMPHAPSWSPRPTHAQCAVEYKLLLRPFALPAAAEAGGGGGGGGGGSSSGSLASGLRGRRAPEWEPARDERSGLVYWVGSADNSAASTPPRLGYAAAAADGAAWQVTWTAPQPTRLLPQLPFRIECAGAEREPVLPAGELDELLAKAAAGLRAGPAPLVRATLIAVWERAIPPAGSTAGARSISPATERWRLVKLV